MPAYGNSRYANHATSYNTSSSSSTAANKRGRFVQSRFRCAVSEETCSYEDVATCLLDVDFLIDWKHVRRVDVLVDARKPLVCSICLESSFQIPRITRCGHCFCYPCATRYLLRDEETGILPAGVSNPATKATELRRKCPVCKEMCYLEDLRPVRFQYCDMQVGKMKKFVRVFKDKERPGITCFAPMNEVEEYRKKTMISSSSDENPSRSSIAENFNQEKLQQLPTTLPREQIDPGWYFSRLIVTPEQSLEQERRNDLLGLLKLADNCRKLRPDNNGTFADTEMLPFLDFLVNLELVHFQKFGITNIKEFLSASTLSRQPGKRSLQQLYDDIVYDRKLHEVTIDMNADILQFTQNLKRSAAHETKKDTVEQASEQAVIGASPDDVLVEELTEEPAETIGAAGTAAGATVPTVTGPDRFAISAKIDNQNHIDDSAYYFYQAWDSQPVFIAPFFMNILRHDKKLPRVLDVSKISYGFDFGNSQHSVNNRLFEQHSDCVTAETRMTTSLFKRLPLKLELSLVDFDIQPFVSENTYWHFQEKLDRRQHEKQRNKKRQKADEKWMREKAKYADEKLMEELKKRSWMGSPHANFSKAPTASDFALSLEASNKVAEFEARTKRKIDDEELAKIISAHELEMEEKAKIEAQQREIKRQREEEEEKVRKTNEKVKDAFGSSDEDDDKQHLQAALHNMLFGKSTAQKSGLKWEKDQNTEGATTMAQKIREEKLAKNKNKKEETNQKYFPSLAETLGGNKATKNGGAKATRAAVFETNKEAAAPSAASASTGGAASSSSTGATAAAASSASSANDNTFPSAPFSPEMKPISTGATTCDGPSSPAISAAASPNLGPIPSENEDLSAPATPNLGPTPSESEDHSATATSGGAAQNKNGKKKKPQKIRLFG